MNTQLKWSKSLTPEQLEQYKCQQTEKWAALDRQYEAMTPEQKQRVLAYVPPLTLPAFPVRHRAEVLLKYEDEGELELSEGDREELLRIAVAPKDGDEDFLGEFDAFYEAHEPDEE